MFKTIIFESTEIQNISHRSLLLQHKQKWDVEYADVYYMCSKSSQV